MPTLIASAVLPLLVNASVGLAIVPGTLSAIATGIGYAATAGIAILGQSLFGKKPEQPRPEDVQSNVRQPVPPRTAFYGQVKAGGPYLFRGTKQGQLHQIIALASCQIGSVEEFWIDDNVVEIEPDGRVETEPYDGDVRIEYRLGLPTETAYAPMISTFPGKWTFAHRADGVASLYTMMKTPDQDNMSERFPSLQGTLFRVVMRRAGIYDPTSPSQSISNPSTWTYSDNLARVVMDYLWNKDGMRIPVAMLTTPQALTGWQQAVQDCDDAIPLKAGGTEPRYRIWNTFAFNERPGDVLRRFLAAGNGRLVPTADGGLYLEVGKWRAPTVTIDETMITGFSGLTRGKSIMDTANTIRAQYLSPAHDYQSTDADPWIDLDDVAERGEISRSVEFIASPSHGQTRRLMKIEAHRAAPSMAATILCNLGALAGYGERFVRLQMPSFGIDTDVEVLDFQFTFGEHSTLIGATLQVQALGEEAFTWDAATEEGTTPAVDKAFDEHVIPAVENFAGMIVRIANGTSLLPIARLSWGAPTSAGLNPELRYKKLSDAAWQTIPILPGATTADSPVLEDGADYEFQARWRTSNGRPGAWGASVALKATADPNIPATPEDFQVAVSGPNVTPSARSANDNTKALVFKRGTTAQSFDAATQIGYYSVTANQVIALSDSPGAGTWRYWVYALNASGVASTLPAGPVDIVVTP